MEDRNGLQKQGVSGLWSIRNEEFDEEDIWGVLSTEGKYSSKVDKSKDLSASISIPRHTPTTPRMITRANIVNSRNSIEGRVIQQQTAPVNIPDWSKIYRKKPSKNGSWLDDDDDDDVDNQGVMYDGAGSDDEDDGGMPPHEWVAHRLARCQISSFSVCEGVGRTLKGRDLSKVRNAVLTKTGFLESLPHHHPHQL